MRRSRFVYRRSGLATGNQPVYSRQAYKKSWPALETHSSLRKFTCSRPSDKKLDHPGGPPGPSRVGSLASARSLPLAPSWGASPPAPHNHRIQSTESSQPTAADWIQSTGPNRQDASDWIKSTRSSRLDLIDWTQSTRSSRLDPFD